MVSRTPTPALVKCPHCKRGRYAHDYLPQHIALNHPEVRRGPIISIMLGHVRADICQDCGAFTDPDAAQKHRDSHGR